MINIEELKKYQEQFAATLDDDNEDEWYISDRRVFGFYNEDFIEFVETQQKLQEGEIL